MPTTLPLAGLTVVSLEQAVAAPYCSSRLADAGARVIKIERPEGDFARFYDNAAKGLSSYFVWLNRGKQSLVADIKAPADAALLHAILARADVFIQNLAPGAAARAGFGSDDLRARYPRLITVDISGYGDTGEYATMKAYDLLVQAESGLAMITGHPAGPGRVGVSACDIACGMAAHAGVLEALIQRGITGQGKGLKVSLFDGMADWMNVPLLYFEGTGRAPERLGLAHPSICPYGAFATCDGALVLISIQNEREWAEFCARFMDEADLPARAGYESNVVRVANRAEVDAHIGRVFARLTRDQAAVKLRAANTAYGFVNDVAAFSRHPALRRATVATPNGPIGIAAPPVIGSDGPRELGPVPGIGEHSDLIRREFAAGQGG
jgi:itaconate CoA-transferase